MQDLDILDALDAQVAVLDRSGVIRAVNRSWREFGRANGAQSDFLDEDYIAFCLRADGAESVDGRRVANGLRAVIDGVLQRFSFEYPCHSPETRRWFSLSARRQDSTGGVVVSHYDITLRTEHELAIAGVNAELEERVAERTRSLERSNADLEAFTYAVAHQLKAPLRAMAGYARILEERLEATLEAPDADYLGRVGASAQEMSNLIEDLLRASRGPRSARGAWLLDSVAPLRAEGEDLGPAVSAPAKAPRLLFAEDSADDRELIRFALEKHLPQVILEFVADGAEALTRLNPKVAVPSADQPTAVFLDIQMPKVSGLEVLASLRADPRTASLPVLMLSASAEAVDVERAYSAGCTAYVVKPTPFEDYERVLVQACTYALRLAEQKVASAPH